MVELLTMDESTLRAGLRDYINQELVSGEALVRDDTELLVSGLLDSLAVTQLLEFIEKATGTAVPAGELVAENFESVDAIVAYLAVER